MSHGMTVCFRTDASTAIGTGHVSRCLELARALITRGAATRFVCRSAPGDLIDLLRSAGQQVDVISASPDGAVEAEEADARQTVAHWGSERPDWVIVDHYGLGRAWERSVRPCVGRLMAIDDLPGRSHDVDLLLNQNYGPEAAAGRADAGEPRVTRLLGPAFALLNAAYAECRDRVPARDRAVERVVVYFGGTDAGNLTGLALRALCRAGLDALSVDVVLGVNSLHRGAVETLAAKRPRTTIHQTQPHLAELMSRADIAIGAGGVTTWERMCLGVPTVAVSLAENQRSANEALAADGLVTYLGQAGDVSAEAMADAVSALAADPSRRVSQSDRARAIVDGRGAARVADLLLKAATPSLVEIRERLHDSDSVPAGFESFRFAWIDRCDAERVRALRNRPHVTRQMRSSAVISAEEHAAFLAGYGRRDRYDFILIDTALDRYVGAFYVTQLNAAAEVGKYVGDTDYLHRGVARRAMEALLAFCRERAGIRRLHAVTREDNTRNIALNTALGFVASGPPVAGFIDMCLDL